MKSKRFLISLMISLFINICLINIFSQILAVKDFLEKKETSMSVINIEFLSPEYFQQPSEEIKNHPELPKNKDLKTLNEENNKNIVSLSENDDVDNKKEDKKARENMQIAKEIQEQDKAFITEIEDKKIEQLEEVVLKTDSETQSTIEIEQEQVKSYDIEAKPEIENQPENELKDNSYIISDSIQAEESNLSKSNFSVKEKIIDDMINDTDTILDLTGPYEMGNQIDPPRIISFSYPDYPENLRKRGIEGDVQLRVYIDKSGNVIKGDIYSSSGYINFDEQALQAVYRWQFESDKSGDVARESLVIIPIKFKLK
ncbi:MAG: energy transducer TonB [Atribacterota bacterium]|nr:energy transducer TonB [Atribacterota bacterium]